MSEKVEQKQGDSNSLRAEHTFSIFKLFKILKRMLPKDADTILKLAAAFAVVFAAFIAKSYESKMSAVDLITKREEAESNLRANMFNRLIDPIAGPYTKDEEIKPDRELLLVKLLALNFHEHFEFKPLLLHVDERLALELKKDLGDEEIKKFEKARHSLISIARRVIDRQIALLMKEGSQEPVLMTVNWKGKSECDAPFGRVKKIDFSEDKLFKLLLEKKILFKSEAEDKRNEKCNEDLYCFKNEITKEIHLKKYLKAIKVKNNEIMPLINIWRKTRSYVTHMAGEEQSIPLTFRQLGDGTKVPQTVSLNPPSGRKYSLEIMIYEPDWDNQTVKVSVGIRSLQKKLSNYTTKDFTLTWFDLPFTDNTLLSDGNRFSIFMNSVDKLSETVSLKLVWFPPNYFTARERPINFSEFRKKLGLEIH